MANQAKTNREGIVAYIDAVHNKGFSKRKAYSTFVNPDIKHPDKAVTKMEASEVFTDVYNEFMSGTTNFDDLIAKARANYVGLVNKTIDVTGEVLNDAKTSEEKSKAVKLATNTISALGVVNGTEPQDSPRKKIDRGGIVI